MWRRPWRLSKQQHCPLILHTTHVSQPLDVAVSRPLKAKCDIYLKESRRESRNASNIPKTVFPALLKRILRLIGTKMGQSLVSGNYWFKINFFFIEFPASQGSSGKSIFSILLFIQIEMAHSRRKSEKQRSYNKFI